MDRIVEKQFLITGYLEYLVKLHFTEEEVKIITPTDPKDRGSQLSLVFSGDVEDVHKGLESLGVVVRRGLQ